MASLNPRIQEFIRASEALLELQNLSDEEYKVIREVLVRLEIMFPDLGDNAAD
ncbi:MAG TPA: hypothetical protein VGK56_14865 [Anaerolineales bacterium]